MNLLDAFKQYIRDAMPGGALNPEVTTQGVLDAAALGTAPVPVLGDAIGLAADVKRLKDNPGERTPMNFGLAALGALPFVPGLAGIVQGGKVADALNAKHGAKLDAYIMEGDKLHLSKVVVPKDARNAGAGTDFMRDLVSAADKQGKTVTLTPSSDFGGNKARLEQFYKRFGFVPNKGRTKDYEISEAMYRLPQQPTPSVLRPPQADALETARKNAVTMLGLPPNNTPMDRAKALGFDADLLHGTDKELLRFDPNRAVTKDHGWYGDGAVYLTPDPDTASAYSNWKNVGAGPNGKMGQELYGQNVMPLMVRRGNVFDYGNAPPIMDRAKAAEFSAQVKGLGFNTVEVPNKYAAPEYAKNYETVVFDPSRIRSRFAAFDPARINENDLLGRADLGLLGLLAGGSAGAAYLMRDEEK